jgi:hypothetical protein
MRSQFLVERPSIANPTERAMMNEGVEVIIVRKLRRKCAVGVSYCDLFAAFIVNDSYIGNRGSHVHTSGVAKYLQTEQHMCLLWNRLGPMILFSSVAS